MEDLTHPTTHGVLQEGHSSQDATSNMEEVAAVEDNNAPKKTHKRHYPERGHVINVARFYELKQTITGFGDTYSSSVERLTLAHMNTLYNQAEEDLYGVTVAKAAKDVAIAKVIVVFNGLEKKSTRAKNLFKVCGAPAIAVNKCNTLNHKIQGTRVEKIIEDDSKEHISASQTSRPQLINHIDALIELFQTYPEYQPTPDLTAQAFTILRNEMMALLQEASSKVATYKMALLKRDITLYKPLTGLVDVAQGVKTTTLGIFGFNSPQHKMVKSLQFTRPKGYKNL